MSDERPGATSYHDRIWPKNAKGNTFGVDDFLRLQQPDVTLRWCANMILNIGLDREDAFTSRMRDLLDIVPQNALAQDPAASELEAFRHALKVSLALVFYAVFGGRRDLQHVLRSLHMGVLAVEERIRGIDELMLQAKHSPTAGREDHYVKCVKTWSAMAALALVEMGMPRKEAAKKVADVLNRHQFLPPKRSGITVVPRSILNWMARWEDGDLKYIGCAGTEFRDALVLSDQGHAKGAERKLLALLTERLTERRDFQLFPKETSALP